MRRDKRSRREAKALFRACLEDGRLDEERVLQAVTMVLERKPRGHHGILGEFRRLVKLAVQARCARVESAVALEEEIRERIGTQLARLHGEGLSFTFAENPRLLGGIRIQVGSDVYDGTIRSRLKGIEAGFAAD